MSDQKCAQCVAPLPLGDVGSIVTCTYCGTQARVLAPAGQSPFGGAQVNLRVLSKEEGQQVRAKMKEFFDQDEARKKRQDRIASVVAGVLLAVMLGVAVYQLLFVQR